MKTYIFILISTALLLSVLSCKEHNEDNSIRSQIKDNFSSSNLKVNDMTFDADGVLFIAANDGLYSFNGKNWIQYTSVNLLQEVTSVVCVSSKEIYIGTKNGVFLIKEINGNYENAGTYSTSNSDIVSDSINTINIDGKDQIWFGTELGANYESQGKLLLAMDPDKYLKDINISSIAFLHDSYFFATYGKYMINVYYDPEIDAITGASQMIPDFNGPLTTDTIYCVIADVDTNAWYGSTAGLTKSHRIYTHVAHSKFEYFLEGYKVFSILEASNGNIWAGTNKGVSVYNKTSWTKYSTIDGISSNNVYAIAKDSDGNIWIGTDKGISMFDGSKWNKY